MRVLRWVLIMGAVIILAGGLIYDGTREGEEPNLAPLYLVAVALAVIAAALGARRTGSRR